MAESTVVHVEMSRQVASRPGVRLVTPLVAVIALSCSAGPPDDGRRASAVDGGEVDRRPVSSAIVDRTHGPCRVALRDAAAGELALRACRRAADRLEELLGRPMAAGAIVEDRPADGQAAPALRDGEVWIMAVASDGALDSLELGAGAWLSAEGYLAHETAHRMATATLFAGDDTPPADAGYGSPLPDWLDEALGLLVEPAGDQSARVAALFDGQIIYALPLRQFLYMNHPAMHRMPTGSAPRRIFYGQSLAFAQFVRERAGIEGLRTLVTSLRAGDRQGEALTALPGLPDDGGTLEQSWLAWLRERQASRAPP